MSRKHYLSFILLLFLAAIPVASAQDGSAQNRAAQNRAAQNGSAQNGEQEERPLVLTAQLSDEAITPATERYLQRAMQQAREQQAECLVVLLDTPGGLLRSTRTITKAMLGSDVPVIIYVAPSGARAASAGLFITLGSHVAAMAPGTTIGAAHPVQLGGLPTSPQPKSPLPQDDQSQQSDSSNDETEAEDSAASPMEEKILNDTVAWARALAQRRGRNADWAADAVRKSVSITAEEAKEKGVVEVVASDLDALLADLDGREVQLAAETKTLRTAGARIERVPMWWGERLLSVIAQPNVAFLLMMFGFYGILFEFYNPGWGVSGTLGVVCILLGLFGLAVLPVNYLGLALIFCALALFTAEVFVTSFGALTAAGVACMILGGAMLIDSPSGFARISWTVLLPVAAATAAVTLLLVSGIVRTHRAPVQTGGEGLVGQTARAAGNFDASDGRYRGTVLIHGERWRAESPEPLKEGQSCRVEDREGLTLIVS